MNSPIEKEILAALIQLDAAVKSMPTANPKPNLLPLFAHLDELTKQLPRNTDPTLLHYMHKKSFEKARLFLQGRDAENQIGNCRHV
ncbi:MAG TPA: hypothetical protein VK815_03395 [Candidatus Acidoferrales bacterium]|jgi:hypothetical protein|nr:hypothetical protein [Candidatus Acidoferrales bacterium]